MSKENLLKKVQALLKLAENNANVNEAASAFAKAQRLIQEHNLSMVELDSSEDEEEIQFGDNMYEGVGKLSSWKGLLGKCIGEANSCFIFTSQGFLNINGKVKSTRIIKIIGCESDIKIANYMFVVMSREIERLCKIAPRPNMGRGQGRIWANSFKLGAVSAIREQFKNEKKDVFKDASAAVLVKVEQRFTDVQNWANKNVPGLKTTSNKYRKNNDAFCDGYKAGKNIHAKAGISTSSTRKLLGS